MDLIYADENRKDIGVMRSFNFDMAFGDDENDFECVIDRSEHCCNKGYFLYVEGEEYGGIIDGVKVSTEKDEITYSGRTWHGILESKIICPEKGQDYAEYEGEANSVLKEIIEQLDLSTLFEVSSKKSGIEILPFQMERYVSGYTGIRKMLRENDAKLKMLWKSGKVFVEVVHRYDYSQDDEFNTSQVDFNISRNLNPCNHLICLGQGNLQQRAVIHLFTDENGGIQPYSKSNEPLQDYDYILDESQKLIFGEDEVVKVYDSANSEISTNYIELSKKPDDWEDNCENYFYRTETKINETEYETNNEIQYDYKSVEREAIDVYTLLRVVPADWNTNYSAYFIEEDTDKYSSVPASTTYEIQAKKPSDWKANYGEYYIKSGASFNEVEPIETKKYTKQTKKPSDWKKNYSKYFEFYSDGVTTEYQSVSGITKYKYVKQTRKPTDWSINYKNYYKKKKTGGYESIDEKKTPSWKKNKYFTRQSYSVAPVWKKDTYYTESTKVSVPTWETSKYYTKNDESPPTWEKNKYYTKSTITPAPKFVVGTYFYAVQDRYAVLVENGISLLNESWNSDELSIDLAETDQVYDIDDIVGAYEHVTGIEAIQNVVKKIIKICNDDITITYEVK